MSFASAKRFRRLKNGGFHSSLGKQLKAAKDRASLFPKKSKRAYKKALLKLKRRNRPLQPIYDTSGLTERQIEYRKYLQSEHWKLFRLSILAKRGVACEQCGSRHGRPDLHHKTYARLGAELESDVEILCRICHQSRHRKPRPTIQPKGSLVGIGSDSRPVVRNEGRSGSPAAPSARPMHGRQREGRGEAVRTLTLNQQGSEYPGQAGA